MIGFKSIASFLPERRVKVVELPEYEQLSPEEREVYGRLGIETVIDDDRYGNVDLAAEASRRALAKANLDAGGVDLILLCASRAPDYLMSSEATRLQREIGAKGARAFAIADLGCASISAALMTARDALLASEEVGNVLVACGSKPFSQRRFRHPVTIAGDGGAAAVLSRDGAHRVLGLQLETNGQYWDLYRIDFRHMPVQDWAEECRDQRVYAFELAVESRNRFRKLNQAVLAPQGLGYGEVDHFLMQNLSVGAHQFYERFFRIRMSHSCAENLRDFGHLGSIDVLLNMERGLESGEFKSGDTLLAMNNSPVAAWSSMLCRL